MFKNFKMTFNYDYIVNDKAVICFASPNRIDKNLEFWVGVYIRETGHKPKNTIAPEYKGVARFKEGDVYDPDTAEEIARCKAVRAAFNAYKALYFEIFEFVSTKAADLYGTADSIEKKTDKITNEIIEMTQ